jgi:hypothetical protein
MRRTPLLARPFLIGMGVLMLQIIETRLLSAMPCYYLAFFMARFGMTAESLFVCCKARLFSAPRLLDQLSWKQS